MGCAFCKRIDPIIEELNNEGKNILRLDLSDKDNEGLKKEISEKEKKRLEKAYGFYLPDVIDEIQEKSKDQGFDIMSDSDFDAQFYNQ